MTSILASSKKFKTPITQKPLQKSKKLTESGLEKQFDVTGKLHTKNIHIDVQILIAVDKFSKWPAVKICGTSETREVMKFLSSYFNLYGIPETFMSDKGGTENVANVAP